MSNYIPPRAPGAFDFKAFSESTQKSFALLIPLMELEKTHGSSDSEFEIVQKISEQATEFMAAVKSGVEAAQLGYTATVDIIELVENVDSMSPDDRAAYLSGTFDMATTAYDVAKQAHEALRDVRVKIFQLTSKTAEILRVAGSSISGPSEEQNAGDDRAMPERALEDLRAGLDILERFASEVSSLAQWWDWIKVETQVEPNSRSVLAFDESTLTQNVEQWELLRKQFADYNAMVDRLEDTNATVELVPDCKTNEAKEIEEMLTDNRETAGNRMAKDTEPASKPEVTVKKATKKRESKSQAKEQVTAKGEGSTRNGSKKGKGKEMTEAESEQLKKIMRKETKTKEKKARQLRKKKEAKMAQAREDLERKSNAKTKSQRKDKVKTSCIIM